MYIWKIADTDICPRCNLEVDNIEHYLVACTQNLVFWNSLFTWWKSTVETFFPIDTYDIILGLPNPNKDAIIKILNYTLLHGIYYIHQCNRTNKIPELYQFLVDIKNTLKLKRIQMISDNKEDKFVKDWNILHEAL